MFPAAMDECPVCLEPYDGEEHIPKSLDCRHAVCKECLLTPLKQCPLCRRGIGKNLSAIPNDLSIIAYLEKNKHEQSVKEKKEKIQSII